MKHPAFCMIAACLASAALAPQAASARTLSVPAPAASVATVTLTPDSVNSAAKDGVPVTGPTAFLRAQILLDRARFGPGEIDAANGSNLRRALAGYQRKQGIKDSGTLDAATWKALNADPAEALTIYTIADTDLTGPFQPIPEDMAAKAKLPALVYASALEALGERFHASPALLQRLNPGKDFARAGEQIVVPNVEGTAPLPKAGKIVVDRSERTLTLYDTENKVIAQYPSSSGTDKDPLPIGSWKVNGISKNPVFHYNPKLFWDAKASDEKATIAAGPNNPVGVAWIDLSKPHYGIHGTPVPGAIGKTQSHGCIRLTNWDVQAVTEAVGPGTPVLMQE